MNNFNMTNTSWQRFESLKNLLRVQRESGIAGDRCIHISHQAVIANKDYVCYLAQEWAGARK